MGQPQLADFSRFLLRNLFFQLHRHIKIIFLAYLVIPYKTAGFAAMADDPLVAAVIQINRPHHAAADSGAIARINVDMLGPKAFGAMIGKTGAFDLVAALSASEIFDIFDKSHIIIKPPLTPPFVKVENNCLDSIAYLLI